MSYRRDDTDYPAAWLFRELAKHFGRDQVFKDVDSIELGDDFIEVITNAVASCHVLLALIGRRWLTVTGQDGRRRLDSPDDFVRLEIEAALARNVRVIPVLVEAAQMPRADELPASLAKLVRRQALDLSSARFDLDIQRLLRVLDRTIAEDQGRARPVAAVRVSFGDVHAVPGSDRPVSAVAFSPDGWLACGTDDGTVRLWDLATGTVLTTLTGHRGAVHEMAFSRDGRRVATGAGNGIVRLWDPGSGTEQTVLTGHDRQVWAVAFSPDGRWLASAGEDWTVRLWDCEAMGALSVLRLDAPIKELTWSRETIALRKGGSAVVLDVVTPK
ncbi:MAG: TIR domain-containing protein [Streptosporangiaceae bacterium]